jgi:hypothetical protein
MDLHMDVINVFFSFVCFFQIFEVGGLVIMHKGINPNLARG